MVTTTFKFHFEIGGNAYNFAIEAENIDEAKRILADHMAAMLKEIAA